MILDKPRLKRFRRHGVDTQYIVYGEERMGVYFLENGAIHRASRIVYDRFNSAFAHIKPGMIDWDDILKDVSWFHWTGITPAISQGAADVCHEAIQTARKKGITISGDINYRRNLWQYGKTAREIMPALIESTDVIVAGIADMENCVGISGKTFESLHALLLKRHIPIQKRLLPQNEIQSVHLTIN